MNAMHGAVENVQFEWPPSLRKAALAAALAVVYLGAGRLGIAFAFISSGITPLWLPTGISIAALLIWGYGLWPGVFVGAFLINLWAFHSTPVSLAIAAGNVLEASAGACLVNRFARGLDAFNQPQDALKFAVLAGVISPLISSAVGAASLYLGGLAKGTDIAAIWLTWWTGNGMGAVLGAPVLILWSRNPQPDWGRGRYIEAAAVLSALFVAGQVAFGSWPIGGERSYPIGAVLFPILVWIAFRFTPREMATATLILPAVAAAATAAGHGPFASGRTPSESLILLQFFNGVMAVTMLTMSIISSNGRKSREQLQALRDDLERRIEQRTADLFTANEAVKEKETQLSWFHRMEEMGRIAGGIAHEFNNTLTGIAGLAKLVQTQLSPDHPGRADAEKIIDVAKQAGALTGRLLSLSRQTKITKKRVSLNELVEANRKMLSAILGENIELKISPAPDLPPVMADPGQLDQILVNLCLNARDAIQGAGSVLIETQAVTLTAAFVTARGFLPPGPYARLTVSDSGSGIAEKDQSKLFEPFFTTKKPGQGTGLGLALVYGIVKDHGGLIDFATYPGRGTSLTIYLPAAPPDTETVQAQPGGGGRSGKETVLLAEDNSVIRNMISRVLSSYGYKIVGAGDGQEAVEIFENHKDSIDLAILDVVMPKSHGTSVYEHILSRGGGTKVLFISGYSAELVRMALGGQQSSFLAKPFTPEELADHVRKVLDAK